MINKMGIKALKLSPEALALIGPDLEKYFDPTAKAYAEMATNDGGTYTSVVKHARRLKLLKMQRWLIFQSRILIKVICYFILKVLSFQLSARNNLVDQ
jgi:hypothetical protein